MNNIGIDISKIPLEILKKGYHDYRLIQQTIEFGDDTNTESELLPPKGRGLLAKLISKKSVKKLILYLV